MDRLSKRWSTGTWLFLGFALLNLIPLFLVRYFPSMDGPAHQYNARLLIGLLQGNDAVKSFFAFNPVTTNITDHIILALLQSFLPAWLAGKIVQAICILGLPLAFRYLLLRMKGSCGLEAFLIFPFSYSFVFLLGFYNFCLAIILGLVLLAETERYFREGGTALLLALGMLFLFLWFTHAFVFLCIGLAIFLLILTEHAMGYGKAGFSIFPREKVKRSFLIFLASVPSLLLAYSYLLRGSYPGLLSQNIYLPKLTLFSWLAHCRPLVLFSWPAESSITAMVSILILIAVIQSIFTGRSKSEISIISGESMEPAKQSSHAWRWLPVIFVFLILFFILPDYKGGKGGHLSVRLATLAFIFTLIWIGQLELNTRTGLFIFIGVISISLARFYSIYAYCLDYSSKAEEIVSVTDSLKPGSILWVDNFDNNWIQAHLPNYAGIGRPVVMENYEADTRIFPVRWTANHKPILEGNLQEGTLPVLGFSDSLNRPADYILIWGVGRPETLHVIDSLRGLSDYTFALTRNVHGILLQPRSKSGMNNVILIDSICLISKRYKGSLKNSIMPVRNDSQEINGQFFNLFEDYVRDLRKGGYMVLRAEMRLTSDKSISEDMLLLIASVEKEGHILGYTQNMFIAEHQIKCYNAKLVFKIDNSMPEDAIVKIYIWNKAILQAYPLDFNLWQWKVPLVAEKD